MPLDLTCEQVNAFLDDYLDGHLTWFERASFHLHLAICSQCRRYLASYRQTIRLAKACVGPSSDEEYLVAIPTELVQAILAARRSLSSSSAHSRVGSRSLTSNDSGERSVD